MKGKLKKLAAIILSAAMLCSGLTAFAADTAETNLVAGIVPTDNTSGYPVNKTVNGNKVLTDGVRVHNGNSLNSWTVRGDYSYSNPPTLYFDLGSAKKVGKVIVCGSSNYASADINNNNTCYYALAKNYDIMYSTDGTSYTVAKEVRGNSEQFKTSKFSNITAQYWAIKVYLSSNAVNDRARIVEIEMFEGEDYVVEAPSVAMTTKSCELFDTESMTLSATASCDSSDVTSVAFYNGTAKLADAALSDGVWTATVQKPTAGEYFVTARAETEAGGTAESTDSVRIRVHSDKYTNIALHKDLTLTNAAGNTNTDCLVDGVTNKNNAPNVWFTNKTNSSTNPLGATATIDLASGFDNEFLISSISVCSGAYNSDNQNITDFTLQYYSDAWYDAVTVTADTAPTGAPATYTYTFPTAVVASKVRLVSNQSANFRVREIEVKGKLYVPTITKTKTSVTDASGNVIKQFKAGTVVNASASITNQNDDAATVTAILAVKESDGTLLAADLSKQTMEKGVTKPFALSAEIPDDAQNAEIEIYWLKMDTDTLVSWFDTESYKSKEPSPYSNDELVVSVASTGFKVYVKGTDAYSNNYVEYNFKHINDTKINANLYRVYEAYAKERTGENTFVSAMDGTKLLTNGELEFAVREFVDGKSADDFIGGFHGDENLTDVTLKLDGTPVDLSQTGVYTCEKVEFVQESEISRRDQTAAAYHKKSYAVDKNGIVLDQKVEWLSNIDLDSWYLCMLPVYRLNGDTQITDFVKYTYNGDEVIVDTRDNKENTTAPVYGVTEATVYSGSNGYSAYAKVIPGTGVTEDQIKFHIWERVNSGANDTKLYFGHGSTQTVKTVAAGDVWEWQNIYKLDLADADASATASTAVLACDSEYDVNERAEVYVTTDVIEPRSVDIYNKSEKLGRAVLTEDGYFFA